MTAGWMSDAYGTINWKHFSRFKVILWLVEFHRIFKHVVFFNGPSGNKTKPSESCRVYIIRLALSIHQDLLNTEFLKVYEVHGINSLWDIWKLWDIHEWMIYWLHTGLLLWGHFHAPKHETWLVALPVSHTASWAVLGDSKQLRKTNYNLSRQKNYAVF